MWSNLVLFAEVDPNSLAFKLGFIVGVAIAMAILFALVSMIGGLILKLLAKWICWIDLPYTTAMVHVFIPLFIIADFTIILQFLFGFERTTIDDFGRPTMVIQFLSTVLAFLFFTFFWGCVITDNRKTPIGFGYGALLTLCFFFILLLPFFLLGVAIGLVLTAAGVNGMIV